MSKNVGCLFVTKFYICQEIISENNRRRLGSVNVLCIVHAEVSLHWLILPLPICFTSAVVVNSVYLYYSKFKVGHKWFWFLFIYSWVWSTWIEHPSYTSNVIHCYLRLHASLSIHKCPFSITVTITWSKQRADINTK